MGALGRVTYRTARTVAEAETILSAFLAQKAARFRAMGISDPFGNEETRSFLHAAATEGLGRGEPAIELSALFLDERVLATFGAAADRRRCSGMFQSFDADPALARYSPGELTLLHVIAAQCAAGRSMFDLGVGEDPYKASLCPEVEPLVDAVLPVTPLGRLYALAQGGAVDLKRRVKQTPWLWSAVGTVRRWRAAAGA